MAQTRVIQTNQSPQKQGNAGLAHLLYGTLAGLACKCSQRNDMDFLIKTDKIVCASCGRQVSCLPPLVGIYMAACDCCASVAVKTTFVLDVQGVYTCTWCGRTR